MEILWIYYVIRLWQEAARQKDGGSTSGMMAISKKLMCGEWGLDW